MDAAIRENKALGLRSTCHHAQVDVARWNVVNSAKAGMTSMEHWYGLPEALFEDKTIQNFLPITTTTTKNTVLKKQENYGSKQQRRIHHIGIK